jgi:hypothetical protein
MIGMMPLLFSVKFVNYFGLFKHNKGHPPLFHCRMGGIKRGGTTVLNINSPKMSS